MPGPKFVRVWQRGSCGKCAAWLQEMTPDPYEFLDREPTVVWGTPCQGRESILPEARSSALILLGDWCGSDVS